jgi:hypothetical protein
MPNMIAGPAAAGLLVLAVRAEINDRMRTAARRFAGAESLPMRVVDVTGTNVLDTHRAAWP